MLLKMNTINKWGKMTVQLSCYEEARFVFQCFSGVLSEDDVWEVTNSLEQRAEHGIVPVHTIIDVRQVTDFPVSIDQISYLRSEAQMKGWMVVVGLHPLVRFLARLMSQMR